MKCRTSFLLFVFLASIVPGFAYAHWVPVAQPGTEGLRIFVSSTGPVTATYQGGELNSSNDLYLMIGADAKPGNDGNPANDMFLFNNHSTPVGETKNLGTFAEGTELMFRLHADITDQDYFTGAASINPDGMFHARVENDWFPNSTLLSFDDGYDGGENHNHFAGLSSTLSNVTAAVPEPEIYAMWLAGLAITGTVVRRRRRIGSFST